MARKATSSEKKPKKIKFRPIAISPGSFILSASTYAQWFNSETVKYAFDDFAERHSNSKGTVSDTFREARMVTTLYAVLVYHLYDKKEEFRNTIQSSNELKTNFSRVKGILDKYGAKASADAFMNHFNESLPKGSR